MNTWRVLAVLGVLLATLFPAQAEADSSGEFTYTPFPALPSTTVISSLFLSKLGEACLELEKLPGLAPFAAPQGCAVPQAPKIPEELQPAIREARKLANAGCATAGPSANVVALASNALHGACSKLYRESPRELNPDDLEILRRARDAPEFLLTVIAWAQGLQESKKKWKITQAEEKRAFSEALSGSQGKGAGGPLVGAASLGSLTDQVIRGMAQFLKERAQKEALRYLRGELKRQLCEGTDAHADLRLAAFSNVCTALASLDDGMSLEAIGSYIRAAAEKDLRRLPDLSLAYLELRYPDAANATFAGRMGLAYYSAVRAGRDPFEVLYSLGELDKQDCEEGGGCSATARATRLASALAYALRQAGADWQQAFDPDSMTAKQRPAAAVAVLLLMEKRLSTFKGTARFSVDVALVNRLVKNPLALVNDALAMVKAWDALEARLEGDLTGEARRAVLGDGMQQIAEIFTRAVENLDRLLRGTPTPGVSDAAKRSREFVGVAAALARRDYGIAVVTILGQAKEVAPGADQSKFFGKYLPLVVEIATAQSSNDVAAAFDAAAAPLGAYELKYHRPMVALNGIFGWTYGWERIDSKGVEGTSAATAAFAPIGVHFSYPACEGLHIGALLTVLDLGAVTALKTTDEDPDGTLDGVDPATNSAKPAASETAEIGLDQVFSPGVYAVLGVGKGPVVVGVGAAVAPRLREVRQGSVVEPVNVLRYGAFLGVDIPILPFN